MTKSLREAAQQALDALAGYRREMNLIRGESYMHGQPCDAEIALRAALAQPEQEPAAWMVYTQDGASAYVTDNPADIGEDQRALPLYTAPPVRHPLAQLKGGGNLPPPLQGSTVAETATTQQPVEQTPPSEYRRGYWDGFAIGKREGRIEAEDALRADAERLAWLDKFALSVDMVADPDNLVQVWHSTTRPPYSTTGSTLREAIDAAREAK